MEGEAELDVTQGFAPTASLSFDENAVGVLLVGSGFCGAVAGAAACVTENTSSIVCLEDEFLGGFLDWQWRSPRTPRRAVGDVSDSTIANVWWQLFCWSTVESGFVFSVAGRTSSIGRISYFL